MKLRSQILFLFSILMAACSPSLYAADNPLPFVQKKKRPAEIAVDGETATKLAKKEADASGPNLSAVCIKKAGIIFAQQHLPERVVAYITQPSKQVDEKIGAQLDAILGDSKIQKAFSLLELHPNNKATLDALEETGFTFLERYDVFKHKRIPGCVCKIANKFALKEGAFASNMGRLWYGDYARTACHLQKLPIIVPQKWIHFMSKPCSCESLHVVIVAQEIDLSKLKLLFELSPLQQKTVAAILKQLRYPDEPTCNVYGSDESTNYVLVDTETFELDFDSCFPPSKPSEVDEYKAKS